MICCFPRIQGPSFQFLLTTAFKPPAIVYNPESIAKGGIEFGKVGFKTYLIFV